MKTNCLNGFTILSYNPNHLNVSFKCRTFLIDEQTKNLLNESDENTSTNNQLDLSFDEEKPNIYDYWIIEKFGKNQIKIINKNNNDIISPNENIKAGPFFSRKSAILCLNYFNEMGL